MINNHLSCRILLANASPAVPISTFDHSCLSIHLKPSLLTQHQPELVHKVACHFKPYSDGDEGDQARTAPIQGGC
jgi:hypothetical protein